MAKNRRGRPSLDPSGGPSADVRLRLPNDEYDRVYQLAQKRRTSMQKIIRQGLRNLLHDQRGGTL